MLRNSEGTENRGKFYTESVFIKPIGKTEGL